MLILVGSNGYVEWPELLAWLDVTCSLFLTSVQ